MDKPYHNLLTMAHMDVSENGVFGTKKPFEMGKLLSGYTQSKLTVLKKLTAHWEIPQVSLGGCYDHMRPEITYKD